MDLSLLSVQFNRYIATFMPIFSFNFHFYMCLKLLSYLCQDLASCHLTKKNWPEIYFVAITMKEEEEKWKKKKNADTGNPHHRPEPDDIWAATANNLNPNIPKSISYQKPNDQNYLTQPFTTYYCSQCFIIFSY